MINSGYSYCAKHFIIGHISRVYHPGCGTTLMVLLYYRQHHFFITFVLTPSSFLFTFTEVMLPKMMSQYASKTMDKDMKRFIAVLTKPVNEILLIKHSQFCQILIFSPFVQQIWKDLFQNFCINALGWWDTFGWPGTRRGNFAMIVCISSVLLWPATCFVHPNLLVNEIMEGVLGISLHATVVIYNKVCHKCNPCVAQVQYQCNSTMWFHWFWGTFKVPRTPLFSVKTFMQVVQKALYNTP